MVKKEQERDYFFDNLRFIFILLVVIAHVISPLSNIYGIKFLYRYIYLFHMPGMIFITGYFAKSSVKDGKLVKNKVFNFMLLYCIFQTIFTLMNHGKFSIYQSQFGLWYLQIIILYSLLLPLLSRVKSFPMMIISIALGLLVGLDASAGHIASLQRVLVFLPFYMSGYYLERKHIEKLFDKKYIILGIILLILIGYLQYKYMNTFNWSLNLSSGKLGYKALKLSNKVGLIGRFIWYIISFLMCASLMTITPKNKIFFSKFGSRTLQVFLLHLPLVVLIRKTNLFVFLKTLPDIYASLIILAFSIAVTLILSLKIFSYPFDYIMKLKFKHILKEGEKHD